MQRCSKTRKQSDILSISVIGNSFWTASASGVIQHYDAQFAPHDSWKAHEGIALASVAHESHLITAGNDALLKVWDLSADLDAQVPTSSALGFRGTRSRPWDTAFVVDI